MTEKPTPTPAEILQNKNELRERWDKLPIEHQASMLLTFLQEVLNGEYQDWMVVALRILFPEIWHDLNS